MIGSPIQSRGVPSPSDNKRFTQLALSVVQYTASQYFNTIDSAPHSPTSLRQAVDTTKWKAFRRRDDMQVFKLRHSADKTQATVLGVGTIQGSLEDVMYGATTPTELSMYMRSLYIEDQFVAHRVLHDIQTPTQEEPFRYLGLKWAARASAALSMVKPRDMVYLEASGFHDVKRERGVERLGYVVYHSVDVDIDAFDGASERASTSVRAKMYLCVLFRDLGLGIIEVYATLTSEIGGSVPHKLAVISAADAVLAIANVSKSALNKKLAWMLNKSAQESTPHRRSKFGLFRQTTTCTVCQQACQPRDIMKRRLVRQRVSAPPVYGPVSVCQACIMKAITLDNVSRIAWTEYSTTDSTTHDHSRELEDDLMLLSMKVNVEERGLHPVAIRLDLERPVDRVHEDMIPAQPPKETAPSTANERMQMIKQMQALCVQAEMTFRMTRQQSVSMNSEHSF